MPLFAQQKGAFYYQVTRVVFPIDSIAHPFREESMSLSNDVVGCFLMGIPEILHSKICNNIHPSMHKK